MSEEHFIERRSGKERRQNTAEFQFGKERRQNVVDRRLGLDLQRGPGRRLTDERKSAEEGQMTDEQFEFLMAIQEYKSKNARLFPTWTEIFEVIKALGYRKVAEPQPLTRSQKDSKDKMEHLSAEKSQKPVEVIK